jgi:hypothetical protein
MGKNYREIFAASPLLPSAPLLPLASSAPLLPLARQFIEANQGPLADAVAPLRVKSARVMMDATTRHKTSIPIPP